MNTRDHLLPTTLALAAIIMSACAADEPLATAEAPPVDEPASQEPAPAESETVAEADTDEVVADAEGSPMPVESTDIEISSDGQAYLSYVAAPSEGGPYPGIILIHSFNGLEDGYRTMTDKFAAQGFVVLAVGWQTFERSPSDDTVRQLVLDGVDLLSARDDVDAQRLGITGFCAGGRYTMLFVPQVETFKAGVA